MPSETTRTTASSRHAGPTRSILLQTTAHCRVLALLATGALAISAPALATSYTNTVTYSSGTANTLTAADTVNPSTGTVSGVSVSGTTTVATVTGTVIGTAANAIGYNAVGSTTVYGASAVSGATLNLNGATIYSAAFGVSANQANSRVVDTNSIINAYANAAVTAQNTASVSLTGTTINMLTGYGAGVTGMTVYTSGSITGSGVTLNSNVSGAVGVYANTGNISLTNSAINNITNATAVLTASTAGSIVLTNTSVSQNGSGNLAYANSGTITLNNVTATKNFGTALVASGASGVASLNTTAGTQVTVGAAGNGVASLGVYALSGAQISLGGTTVTILGGDAGGANTLGVLVTGNGSKVVADGTTVIDVTGAVAGATGIRGDSNATLALTGTTVKAGNSSTAIQAVSGAGGTLRAVNVIAGASSTGISVDGLGTTLTLANASKVSVGSSSTAVRATAGADLTLGNAQIQAVAGATQMVGINANNASVSLTNGAVQTDAAGTGALLNNGASLVLSNTQITGGSIGINLLGAATSASIQAGSVVQAGIGGTAVSLSGDATAKIGSSSITGGANSTGLWADHSSITAIASVVNVGTGGTAISVQNGSNAMLVNTSVSSGDRGVFLGKAASSSVTFDGGGLSADGVAVEGAGTTSTIAFKSGALVTGVAGLLNVHDGSTVTMNADNHSTLNGNIIADASSTANVSLTNGSTLNAMATNVAAMNVASNSQWNVTGDSTVTNLTLNNAALVFVTDGTYKTLTVSGNYAGNGGLLVVNTFLNAGGDASLQHTDRLLINGNVTGTTMVRVNGLGTGGLTGNTNLSGISVIQVGGTSTESAFALQGGYAAAGPYQYRLYGFGPGSSNGAAAAEQAAVPNAGNHWDYRLQNPLVYADGTTKPDTTNTDTPNNNSGNTPAPAPSEPARRMLAAQVPAYLTASNALFQAGQMDAASLHARLGEIRQTSAQGRGTQGEAFMRAYGGSMTYHSDLGFTNYGYDADIDYAGVQLGGNLYTSINAAGTTRVGLAGSFGSLRFTPDAVDGSSKGRSDTYNLGVYATYQSTQGWYVDGVMSGGFFNGDVRTAEHGTTMDLSGYAFNASVEAGYPIQLNNRGLALEPQVGLSYQLLSFDHENDRDGINTDLGSPDQLVGRFGARLTRTFQTESGNQITPYLKANLLYGFSGNGQVTVGGVGFQTGSYGTSAQFGGGVTGELTRNLSLYGDAVWQTAIGNAGTSGWIANAGLRFGF